MQKAFANRFGMNKMKEYQYHIFSPYRVCPLGAHVDHQLDKGVDLWFSVNGSSQIDNGELTIDNYPENHVHLQIDNYPENHVHLESMTFEGVVDFDIAAPTLVKQGNWGDYARGAKYALQKRFQLKKGITGIIRWLLSRW